MASSTEELDLLERVFLRIGSAESDEQLESAVNKFLIPVLLKLSSPNEGVRKKVMELLVHVNKRVKRRPTVQLPVESLLVHYQDPKASSFLINFSILYIKLGYPRLPPEKQEELAPALLLASEGKPKMHQDSLLLLFLSVIGLIKVPVDAEKRQQMFKLDEKPELSKQLAGLMLDMLLLPYAHISGSVSTDESSGASTSTPTTPPGMSEYGMKRVTSSDTPMTPERLEQTKLGIVKFLATGVLPNDDIICHLIIAASDTRFTVANLADTELKRIAGVVNWSSITIATRLFHIYLGSPDIPADKRQLIPPANRITPANTRIRLKILPYLCRLQKDAILFPGSVQVIFNSLYDANTNPKLKLQALNFALVVVRNSEMSSFKKMGGMLYTGLLKLIWNTEESENLRVVGYTIIGQIVKRMPHIINKNLIELQVFFENLSSSQPEIRSAVRDSLLTMIDAFKMFMKEENEKMEVDEDPGKKSKDELPNKELMMVALLSSHIEAPEPMARFVAAKYAAVVFESDHVLSRYMLLLTAGDPNSDVTSVSIKSLYSSFEAEDDQEKKILLPDFRSMSQCVYEKALVRLKNANQRVSVQNTVLPFNIATFNEILTYLRLCLAKSAKVDITTKELIVHPYEHSPAIGRYISESHQADPTTFNNFLSLVEMLLSPSCALVPLNCLLEVVGTCPQLFAARYTDKQQRIQSFLGHAREDIRESSAILLSIICVETMTDEKLGDALNELMKNIESKPLEAQHGALLQAGYILERKLSKVSKKGDDASALLRSWPFCVQLLEEFAKNLDPASPPLLISASCTAIGQIAKCAPLPVPDKSESGLSKHGLMKTVLELATSSKISVKIKEKAFQTCGFFCLGQDFPFVKELVEQFLEIAIKTKDVDIHFTVADAIILCVEGMSSNEKRDKWTVEASQYRAPTISGDSLNLLKWLLEKLIKSAYEPHPHVRQSVCVFLLSIVKKLSTLQTVKDKLLAIQNVFMEFLGENNDIVQDMSSKGLALVYESTTEANKKELMNTLMDRLMSGRRAVQQVTEDTKIFEEGQLGTAPTGGNLSTYKEICSLASDLNQPDLVYKFMHLANHNAVWNSKKGAAFGFKFIASQAEHQLNDYLPNIVPKLYRYRFDPTPKIQLSMTNIWHSIVKDNQKTIEKYYNEILDDLLLNLTSPQWRVRISCCLALSDFISSSSNRSILDSKTRLRELLKSVFRVMDDVHEGTRIAAQNVCKSLSKLCVRACDSNSGKVDQEVLDTVLSVFLTGVTNSLAEVRSLSLQTVSQLVNSAGPTIKPNLPILIPALLEAAGELEHVALSYYSVRFGAQAETQDSIDSLRATAAKSHYTTQTVAKCVQYVEIEMLEVLVPKTVELMKSAHFGTRVACTHFIVQLAAHLGQSMSQYTGKLLAGLVNGLLDRNPTVRKTFASTIGQIVQTAKPTSVERLVNKLSNWYFEKEDLTTRSAIGHAMQAITHFNSELFKEYFPVVIPLVFFAMHSPKTPGEDNSHVVMWEEIWNEITPGSESGIRQHLTEISKILETALSSPSWTMKAQGGRCIATIAVKVGESMDESNRVELIQMVLKSLQGRTFPGKEDLLKGLAKLTTHSADSLKKSPDLCLSIVDALLKECNKTELIYKRHALQALGIVLEAFDEIDRFQQVYEVAQSLLKKADEPKEVDETSQELAESRNEMYRTIAVVYETLGKSWPKNKETQLKYQEILLGESSKALESSPKDIQVAILTAFRCYLEKLHYFSNDYTSTAEENLKLPHILDKTTKALDYSLGIAKHTSLRKEALNIVSTLGTRLHLSGREQELKTFTNTLSPRIKSLEKDSSPEIRTRLMDLKDMFKN